MLAYLATLAGGLALGRLAPGRWAALIGGVALASVLLCLWALLTKVFPGALAADETFARLRAPFEYWNSVGLSAALGIPPMLWLAARRSGHGAVNVLAWPALGLLIVCLLLALLARLAARGRRSGSRCGWRSCRCGCARWRRSPACSSRRCRSSCGRSRRTG